MQNLMSIYITNKNIKIPGTVNLHEVEPSRTLQISVFQSNVLKYDWN